MAHIHNTKDAETHFIINATTREISNAGELPALAKGDHNSEVFTFVANRYVDGHDLTTCNIVKVHYLNIESETRKTYADIYKVEDIHVDEADSTKVVFTWLISKYATQYAGLLNFAIHFNCETDGVIDYSWKTAAFTGITVKNSIDSTEQIMTEYTDILEKWKAEIENSVAHKHDNKNTLDAFGCEMLDNPITDGDFNFGINNEDWNRLKFNGGTILFNSDGAVVRNVETKEDDNGNKVFRMYFNQPGLGMGFTPFTPFVDIPINGANDKFDIGLNGSGLELELPTGGEGGGIAVVHELPIEANDGDICLYSPANIITLADSGKKIYFDWEEFAKPLSAREQYSVRVFSQTGMISLIDFIRTDTAHFVQCGLANDKGTLVIRFENGVLDTTYSGIFTSFDVKKTFNSIDELPRYYELPQFTELIVDSTTTTPMCYAPYQLMVYRGGEWQNVETLFNIPLGVSKTEMETYVTAAINGSLDEIEAMIDEIGSMIDESGVLDE